MRRMTNIILRPITVADTANIVRWRNSWEVKKNLFSQTELTEAQHLQWLDRRVRTGDCFQYIIVDIGENDKVEDIGTVFIKSIDRENQKGEFGIFIGEISARGKGFATLATKEIIKIAFENISLNRVYLQVFSDNEAAVRAYKRAGFMVEGVLCQDFLRYDGFQDVIVMGITKDRWIANGSN